MRATATVRDGMLTLGDGGGDQPLAVSNSGWQRWLEQPGTRAFRFEHGATRFTARRELHAGHSYWYAYRRQGGRLGKVYLGRSADLSLDRLVAAAARLERPAAVPPAATPPIGTAAAPDHRAERHNLPSEVSSFLGREAELAELRRLLTASRLVTLTGAGGMGKTRLALRLAAAALPLDADAVWLVELASLSDGTLMTQAVAQALAVREEPGRPLLATLIAALGAGRVLLVLDNCEHLRDAAAALAQSLLRACPALRILATSRETLGLTGETVWRVPPLGLPREADGAAGEAHARSEAVALFVERAHATNPGFALTAGNAAGVAEICRWLDGSPLAIELAAALVRALTPDEIAARLDDRFRLLVREDDTAPHRHQALETAIEWSYSLLTEAEQRLFARLSIFAGGFTLDTAESVAAGDNIEAGSILGLLVRLVDRSFVLAESDNAAGATRYRLLETLRAYGGERLAERDDDRRLRDRHLAWMLALAGEAGRAFHGPHQGRWLRWAEREHDNVRAALAWALAGGEAEPALRLASALSWSWLVQQRWSEGLDWVRRALALPQPAPTRERGLLLIDATAMTIFRGDLTSNRPSGEMSAVGGWVQECLAIGERLEEQDLLIGAYGWALMLREFGIEVAGMPVVTLEDVLALARETGHTWGEGRTLEGLARGALRGGDLDTAGQRFAEAVALARRTEDGWSLAMALNELGDVERARGRHPRAGEHYAESLALFDALGLGEQPNIAHNLAYVALAAGERGAARAHLARALRRYGQLGAGRGMAECLIGFGAVAAADGQPAAAARLFAAGEAALAALGLQIWPLNRPDYERWRGRARTNRTAAAFDQAAAEGQLLSLEQATEQALRGTSVEAVTVAPHPLVVSLTRRERDVAALAALGYSNRQIGDALAIAQKTAANHIQHVLEKLNLRTRTELAARADEFSLGRAS